MFGICYIADGAIINTMQLVNVLAVSGSIPPCTIDNHDCQQHMAYGGKKDTPFIVNLIDHKINLLNPTH